MQRISIAVLVACLVTGLLAVPADAGEGWWGALDEGEAVSLKNVLRQPASFRDRTITFYCVFYEADGRYKYYPPNTAFTEGNFLNFAVWPDGTAVWDKDAFVGSFPFLYLRRTNSQREELARLQRFTRLECTGRIRDIVRGRPAIEVFSFRPTGHRLGKPIVDSILWGMSYAKQGTRQGYQSAARRFKEALQPDLPPTYDTVIRKLLADALRAAGNPDEADRYERGETVGTPPLPRPTPGTPPGMPMGPGQTFPGELPEPPSGDLPAAPDLGTASGNPDGGASGTAFPPAAPDGAMPAPPQNPFVSGDLPGKVVESGRGSLEKTPESELPGSTNRAPKRVAPRAPASGIPPKRRPRLHGVK